MSFPCDCVPTELVDKIKSDGKKLQELQHQPTCSSLKIQCTCGNQAIYFGETRITTHSPECPCFKGSLKYTACECRQVTIFYKGKTFYIHGESCTK